jgi:hypothetical protein
MDDGLWYIIRVLILDLPPSNLAPPPFGVRPSLLRRRRTRAAMAFNTMINTTNDMLLRAPKVQTIPLPQVDRPFHIWESLAKPTHRTLVDFSIARIHQALGSLTVDEASRPATSPASPVVRIVHNRLASPIYIHPRSIGSNVVTVYDLLAGIHAFLWSEFTPYGFNLDSLHRQEVLIAKEERCRLMRVNDDVLRHIDFLDGATLFAGLVQDIARARTRVATGEDGIDGFQAVTWIMQTQEPPMGLGPYPRLQ